MKVETLMKQRNTPCWQWWLLILSLTFAPHQISASHYTTLGIDQTANEDAIKKAYHKLVMQWHPDKNRDVVAAKAREGIEHLKRIGTLPEAGISQLEMNFKSALPDTQKLGFDAIVNAVFSAINDAHATLKDAALRDKYDRELAAAPRFTPQPPPRKSAAKPQATTHSHTPAPAPQTYMPRHVEPTPQSRPVPPPAPPVSRPHATPTPVHRPTPPAASTVRPFISEAELKRAKAEAAAHIARQQEREREAAAARSTTTTAHSSSTEESSSDSSNPKRRYRDARIHRSRRSDDRSESPAAGETPAQTAARKAQARIRPLKSTAPGTKPARTIPQTYSSADRATETPAPKKPVTRPLKATKNHMSDTYDMYKSSIPFTAVKQPPIRPLKKPHPVAASKSAVESDSEATDGEDSDSSVRAIGIPITQKYSLLTRTFRRGKIAADKLKSPEEKYGTCRAGLLSWNIPEHLGMNVACLIDPEGAIFPLKDLQPVASDPDSVSVTLCTCVSRTEVTVTMQFKALKKIFRDMLGEGLLYNELKALVAKNCISKDMAFKARLESSILKALSHHSSLNNGETAWPESDELVDQLGREEKVINRHGICAGASGTNLIRSLKKRIKSRLKQTARLVNFCAGLSPEDSTKKEVVAYYNSLATWHYRLKHHAADYQKTAS